MGVLRVKVAGNWVDVGVSMPIFGRNLIDNGQFAVKQRTPTSASISTTTVLADRWTASNSGVGAAQFGYSNWPGNGPPGGPRPGTYQYISMNTAEAVAALSAGDLFTYSQGIEGQFLQHLCWGTAGALPVTLSFYMYSSVATTYIVELERFETVQRSISLPLTVPSGWSAQSLTFPGDVTTLITNDNFARITLRFILGAGSTYTSGPAQTSWAPQVAANRATGIGNLLATAVNNQFLISNVQLEVGPMFTPYEVRPYDDELRRAMRCYRQTPTSPNGEGAIFGYGAAGQLWGTTINHPVVMRAIPNVTIAGTWTVVNGTFNYATNGPQNYMTYVSITAIGPFQAYSNNNGYLVFAAEI